MGAVTKKDIVGKVSTRTGLTQVDTKIVLERLLEAISQTMAEGRGIEIRGFGRFKVKGKNPRKARNPRTKEVVDVAGGFKPVFEPARYLKSRVNKALLAK